MTHYELLGLQPKASTTEVHGAIEAARASWIRRRDAATDPQSLTRSLSALDRLAEVERELTVSREAPKSAVGRVPETPDTARISRAETERSIRAEADRRREMRRHEIEMAATLNRKDELNYANPKPVSEPCRVSAFEVKVVRDASKPRVKIEPLWIPRAIVALSVVVALGIALFPFFWLVGKGPRTAILAKSSPIHSEKPTIASARAVAVQAINSEPPPTNIRRAYRAYSSGRYAESLRLFDSVLSQEPQNSVARVAKSTTLLAIGLTMEAEKECRLAIALEPKLAVAHFNLGVSLHRQHREAAAVMAFERFVELAPADPAAPRARGFIARWKLNRLLESGIAPS